MNVIAQVRLNGDLVVAVASSNALAPGFEAVSDEVYAALIGRIGKARLVNGAVIDVPDAPVSVPPPTISDRQFFQALASAPYEIITPVEALNAVKFGEIPAVMQVVIDQLPVEDQFAATMLLSGATMFEFSNPLVGVFGASQSMDALEIEAFWQFASSL